MKKIINFVIRFIMLRTGWYARFDFQLPADNDIIRIDDTRSKFSQCDNFPNGKACAGINFKVKIINESQIVLTCLRCYQDKILDIKNDFKYFYCSKWRYLSEFEKQNI